MSIAEDGLQLRCERKIGGHVCYRLAGWGDSTYDDGVVVGWDGDVLEVESGGESVLVDPRPWPTGNVLPF